MEKLINRGLNFTILPYKLDITEVLVDFKNFARSTIWHEFWFGREDSSAEQKTPIFKNTDKTNPPKNYKVPNGLQTFLSSVKSEILDYKNRNNVNCNISPEELVALKELIRLQREQIITIKACDKGAGVLILDFKEYLHTCYEHLYAKQKQTGGSYKQYNTKVTQLDIMKAEKDIHSVLEESITSGRKSSYSIV